MADMLLEVPRVALLASGSALIVLERHHLAHASQVQVPQGCGQRPGVLRIACLRNAEAPQTLKPGQTLQRGLFLPLCVSPSPRGAARTPGGRRGRTLADGLRDVDGGVTWGSRTAPARPRGPRRLCRSMRRRSVRRVPGAAQSPAHQGVGVQLRVPSRTRLRICRCRSAGREVETGRLRCYARLRTGAHWKKRAVAGEELGGSRNERRAQATLRCRAASAARHEALTWPVRVASGLLSDRS